MGAGSMTVNIIVIKIIANKFHDSSNRHRIRMNDGNNRHFIQVYDGSNRHPIRVEAHRCTSVHICTNPYAAAHISIVQYASLQISL